MRILTLAALAAVTATFASAPAFASSYGHRGHSHGHSHAFHGHSSHGHSSYGHRHAYHAPVYHAPRYVAPTYHAPVYVAPKPTYETRPAYVLQKVQGYCTDVVVKHGYHTSRKTVECKAGEAPKAIEKAPEPKAEEAPK